MLLHTLKHPVDSPATRPGGAHTRGARPAAEPELGRRRRVGASACDVGSLRSVPPHEHLTFCRAQRFRRASSESVWIKPMLCSVFFSDKTTACAY